MASAASTAVLACAARAQSSGAAEARPAIIDEVTVTGRRLTTAAGPGVSAGGANDYAISAQDIADLPTGASSAMTDVLAHIPGVAIDQNQQIHVRNTEGPQFQYQINGILVPLDINTNPSFLSMINPLFVKQLDLLDGVLPARYSYATGGVVNIATKDGCEQPGGSVTLLAGQRETVQTSGQIGGCDGRFSYYLSGLYTEGQTAFSSATPGPTPIHDFTRQGQALGYFTFQIDPSNRLSLLLSTAASDNQLPNVPGLAPGFTLAGATNLSSSAINSGLNFRDYLAILALNGSNGSGFSYQLAYSGHYISQDFLPDVVGELIFQGVASRASHYDADNTLQGDVTYTVGPHTLGGGFYAGAYHVTANDSSYVFLVDAAGDQASAAPTRVVDKSRATNVLLGLYVNDLWRITDRLSANLGVRVDSLTGFTNSAQIDPTVNLTYRASPALTLHGGFARYLQVPSFQGISPSAPAAFAGTTAAGPPGIPTPLTEDDAEWDAGAVFSLTPRLTLSFDGYYEITHHYLDTGQFGVVPIFAPFNYGQGRIWGNEFAITYKGPRLSAYANLTLGENWQKGVATGQFNFDPEELAFINSHVIPLDHQPHTGASIGARYTLRNLVFAADGLYSSGLRGGFADQAHLPRVIQLNLSAQAGFDIPGVGRIVNKIAVLNALDRINLIRSAEGIGIFQAAYGPRLTVLDSVTLTF